MTLHSCFPFACGRCMLAISTYNQVHNDVCLFVFKTLFCIPQKNWDDEFVYPACLSPPSYLAVLEFIHAEHSLFTSVCDHCCGNCVHIQTAKD